MKYVVGDEEFAMQVQTDRSARVYLGQCGGGYMKKYRVNNYINNIPLMPKCNVHKTFDK